MCIVPSILTGVRPKRPFSNFGKLNIFSHVYMSVHSVCAMFTNDLPIQRVENGLFSLMSQSLQFNQHAVFEVSWKVIILEIQGLVPEANGFYYIDNGKMDLIWHLETYFLLRVIVCYNVAFFDWPVVMPFTDDSRFECSLNMRRWFHFS